MAFTVALVVIAGFWMRSFPTETTSKISNKTDVGIQCATSNIEIDDVYMTPGTNGVARPAVKNSGFINFNFISAKLYDKFGNNFTTTSSLPMTTTKVK